MSELMKWNEWWSDVAGKNRDQLGCAFHLPGRADPMNSSMYTTAHHATWDFNGQMQLLLSPRIPYNSSIASIVAARRTSSMIARPIPATRCSPRNLGSADDVHPVIDAGSITSGYRASIINRRQG